MIEIQDTKKNKKTFEESFQGYLNDDTIKEESKPKQHGRKYNGKRVIKASGKTLGTVLDELDRSFQCYFCDKEFTAMKYLQMHRQRHINADGDFPCR